MYFSSQVYLRVKLFLVSRRRKWPTCCREQQVLIWCFLSLFFFPVFFLLVQNEPSVSDLWRGHAVWDGERVMDEEALSLGKVRDVVKCVRACVHAPACVHLYACVRVTLAPKQHAITPRQKHPRTNWSVIVLLTVSRPLAVNRSIVAHLPSVVRWCEEGVATSPVPFS